MNRRITRFVGFVTVTFIVIISFFSNISTAQEGALPPLKVVQIGDSYSAGNGARSESGDRNYHGVSGCYRSPTNWGSQFAQSLGDVFAVTYINRACSGGVTFNILDRRIMDHPDRNGDGSCPLPEYPDEEQIQVDEENPSRCQRVLNPQIDAIDKSVDLVIMTMGGNDVGFDEIVVQCFVPGLRDPAGCRDRVNDARAELGNVERRLVDIFNELRSNRLKPDARVVLVTYPYLSLDEDYQLKNFLTGDTYAATQEIRNLGLVGDVHQRAAVETANAAAGEEYIVLYDGTKDLFAGHEPDPSALEENPDRWLHEFVLNPSFANVDSYHPNPLGHANWARALIPFETFGAVGGSFETSADIDLTFVVDTTGSMGDEIAQVRSDLSSLVGQLAATTNSYRVAVVSYRDFPERTGRSIDYPSRVDQTFTDDLASIQAAINSLTAQGGGDGPETVFSGIQAAIELPWRPGVTKIAIVIGDAPALSPEPISNWTAFQIVANSIAVDPVKVVGVNTGSLDSNGALGQIADGTAGSVIQGTSGLTTKISEILGSAAKQPFAWISQAYSGKIGQPIRFDAAGSYDPSGLPITLYEWDFNSDGVFDLETTEATATHAYDAAFDNYVVLRVTGEGGTALASARTVVNAQGFASQGDEDSCELDENGYSILIHEEGQFIRCTADSLPEADQAWVEEISGKKVSKASIDIKQGAIDKLSPYAGESKRFGKAIKNIEKSLDSKLWATIPSADGTHIDPLRLDPRQGSKVFDHERHAVRELMDLLKGIPGDGCGGVTDIALEYTGPGTITGEAFLKNTSLSTFTVSAVAPDSESTFEIAAIEETSGRLDPEIRLVVDGKNVAKINTSCSEPINIGDVYGDFIIDDVNKLPPVDGDRQVSQEAREAAQTAIDDLVTADRLLVQVMLDETVRLAAINPDRQARVDEELKKAEDELAKGDSDRDALKPDRAIHDYRKSWEHAVKAREELMRLPGEQDKKVPPVAVARVAQNEGDTVTLDGSGSTDPDGDQLAYSWTLTAVPTDSTASLTGADTAGPSFVADLAGVYEAELVVNDGTEGSQPDTVAVVATTIIPQEAIVNLSTLIEDMDLQKGVAEKLDKKLADAHKAIDENDNQDAIGSLNGFCEDVKAESGKKITASQANRLAAEVQVLYVNVFVTVPEVGRGDRVAVFLHC